MRTAGWPSRVQQWTLAAGRAAPSHSQLHRLGRDTVCSLLSDKLHFSIFVTQAFIELNQYSDSWRTHLRVVCPACPVCPGSRGAGRTAA